MKEEWKVYIRGNKNRGEEVIKVLTDLGTANASKWKGDKEDYIYFIAHDGTIDFEDLDSETARIIMDNYTELYLPEKWKDGDLLVCHMLSGNRYAVYSDDSELMECNTIITYVDADNHTYGVNGLFDKDDFKLASDKEHTEFYELLHKHGVDWDDRKKQLVNLKWKPKMDEPFWIVTATLDVNFYLWNGTLSNIEMFNCGNCFKTREEAKIAAKKIRDLFKEK